MFRLVQLNEWLVDSEDNGIWIDVNELSSWSWLGNLSLGGDSFSALLSLVFQFIVLLNSLNECSFAVGNNDVLSSNVNSLLDESTVNGLVDLNTNSSWVNVKDLTSSSVIELMWQTFLDG
jgi:hypothetical protein